ncbi:MAG: hypothetical protein IH945_02710 [Armatimonadetes bacterium]|nr:hypothetical protein [Armatimonadota bacterium]
MGGARGGLRIRTAEMVESIPDWLALYVYLGLGDLAFTLVAFQLGAIELNPYLEHAQRAGVFEFSKVSLTLLVLCIAFKLRRRKVTEKIMAWANVGMICLNVYHISLLYEHFFG